jgi:hypothetical protein
VPEDGLLNLQITACHPSRRRQDEKILDTDLVKHWKNLPGQKTVVRCMMDQIMWADGSFFLREVRADVRWFAWTGGRDVRWIYRIVTLRHFGPISTGSALIRIN